MTKEKLHIPFPVIVEGKYDKIRLSNIMEGQIITTDGFGVFRQKEKRLLLHRLSEASPLILLTDSDGGGKVIRSHLTGMIPPDRLIQVYIPPVRGKERRKIAPSAAGLLGVEGMEDSVLYDLLRPYAAESGIPCRRTSARQPAVQNRPLPGRTDRLSRQLRPPGMRFATASVCLPA